MPVMVPAADIRPPVNRLPPVMLAAEVIVLVADIKPAVKTLPPVMLPVIPAVVPALSAPVTLKLVPVAVPILGVVKFALLLTLMLPPPSNAVVTPSTLALNCDPIKLKPADVLAVYAPAAENCDQVICVVPTVTGELAVHTQPVSALDVPASTNTKAPGISVPMSKSVARVSTHATAPVPTVVTV